MKKKVLAVVLTAAMGLSLAACGSTKTEEPAKTSAKEETKEESAAEESAAEETADVESPVAGKKVAYIMLMSSATIFQMWSENFENAAEKLGMEADTFFCSDDAETFQNQVSACAAAGYDGLMLSHGDQNWAYDFISGIIAQYPDIKIVTFDTPFKDANGETAKIDGVTQFFQQDAGFARDLMQYLVDLPENADKEAPLNILLVQQGRGFNSPFDRRQVGVDEYIESGAINPVEYIAPTDNQNATASMREVATATLAKYADDEIDGIWCCYDAYAQGMYQALQDANRDFPMVSVDLDNADITAMANGDNWKACATTNWSLNGEFALRVLALELADQYDDIAAASCYYSEIGAWLEIPSSLITQDMVSVGGITIENLETVAPESYTDTSWMPTCDWMVALLGR